MRRCGAAIGLCELILFREVTVKDLLAETAIRRVPLYRELIS
jgi:hypothetical protein